ncbi:MAG TPA: diguanylate cyclase [Burkholderiales bacterium]|nr:diguanylate cyclase [Burkholderiales bacterium]
MLGATAPAADAGQDTLVVEKTISSYHVAPFLQYLEDPQGTLAITDMAAAARFRPVTASAIDDVNFGYSHSAYWLALPLRLDADAPAQWLLEIGYPSLDRVEVYTHLPRDGFMVQTAGDLQPFSERPFQHRNLVFPVKLIPGTTQTIYLRVTSEGNLTIPVTLWQRDALYRHDQYAYAGLSIYYGMLLALGLYNLLLFIAIGDAAFLAYVAFVACMAVGQASMNGFGNQFAWPEWPAWGNIALPSGMSATGLFGAVFTRLFLDTRRTAPGFDYALIVLIAVFAFAALSPLFASYQFAAILTSIAGIVASAVITASGVYCLHRGHPGARWFLLAWALLLVGVAVLAMRNLSWLPTNTFTLYSMQIGSALEMLLLSFALADRINVMRREKDVATQEALDAKQLAVETLRRSEQVLESRVAKRTRELEEANAQLRQKEKDLEHMTRHDMLTGLANRVLLDDRLERAIAHAKRGGRGTAVLVIDLDKFKAINDNHGHAVGDDLLKGVAERLRQAVRESDTVARLGGDEFVIVLENLHGSNEALRIADKLLSEAVKPLQLDPGPVQVGLSIGIAFYPQNGTSSEELLKRADQAMYTAKAGGRNRWCVAGDDPDGRPNFRIVS